MMERRPGLPVHRLRNGFQRTGRTVAHRWPGCPVTAVQAPAKGPPPPDVVSHGACTSPDFGATTGPRRWRHDGHCFGPGDGNWGRVRTGSLVYGRHKVHDWQGCAR